MFVHRLKLRPPQVLATWLERPHLEKRLHSGVRVMSLATGPGYGKTVLAARLYAAWTGTKLWYGLDATDRDLSVFAAHLNAGIKSLGVEPPTFDATAANTLGSPREVGTRFAECIAETAHATLFVFDDVHFLEGGRALGALSEFVERSCKLGASFILCGRSIPISLHNVAASAQLVAIGPGDLAFSKIETDAFLKRARGDAERLDSIAHLAKRAEGWAAGLALIASDRTMGEADAEREALTARDDDARQYLFDYLAAEVLESLSERERRFLEETSILDQLETALCDAIRDADDSRALLESFARRGLFVTRQSDDAYAYHQLFRDFLRHTLTRSHQSDSVAQLHRRAAAFLTARGDAPLAIEHRLVAGDEADAAAALESAAFKLLRAGLVTTVSGLMRRLTTPRIEASPTLLAALGHVQRDRGEWDAALSSLERAMTAARTVKAYDVLAEAVRICAPILASRGEFDRLRSMLDEALSPGFDLPETSLTSLRMTKAAVDVETDRLEEALELYREITPVLVARGDLPAHGQVLHNTAVAHLRRGDVYAGLAMYERALKLKESAGQRVSMLTTLEDLVYVKTLLGDVDEARRLVDPLVSQAKDLGATAIVARGLEQRGVHCLFSGDIDGALEAFRSAEAACDPGDMLVLPDIEHGLAQCALRAGDIANADILCARAIAVFRGAGRRQQVAPILLTRASCAFAGGDASLAARLAREAIAASADGPNALFNASVCLDAAPVLMRCAQEMSAADAADCDRDASHAVTTAVAIIHQRDYRFLLRTKAAAFEELLPHMRRWRVGSGLIPDIKDDAALAPLRIEMLGQLRVLVEGEPVPPEAWKRRRALEIFAYLAECAGAGVSRARLIDLFWPESDADAAHDNLRVTITAIRKAVGDVIKYEANAYRFVAPKGATVDVQEFKAHIDAARQADGSANFSEARRRYQSAVDLYRGDFLEGMQEGGWQWRERELLRAGCLESLRWLADFARKTGDARAQRSAVERLLEVAPFELEAVKTRLDALCRESRIAEAKRDYEEWRSRYRAAVGAEAPDIWRAVEPALTASVSQESVPAPI
ncbi:MAG TPA: BTAD domain-containing putative transcriptional regulator [Candidatus Eremiobacteraceae bacterium]|nr:BTAD domain-containing putative transcriptional regulator [Candidatus Eremiobacteraceae bacterium]